MMPPMTMKRTPRPRDPIQLGKLMVDIMTGEVPNETDVTGKSPNRAKGGKAGGLARANSLTPGQRSTIAHGAAQARWKKSDG